MIHGSPGGRTGFLKTLAQEVAASGVTVNSVQPGVHATDRLLSVYRDKPEAADAGIPAGKIGNPGDFGEVVAFRCSQQVGFVTGTHVQVDGGAYAELLKSRPNHNRVAGVGGPTLFLL